MDFVKQMQQQALVLLKNENNILPLDKRQIRKVLVTGPLADEDNFMTSVTALTDWRRLLCLPVCVII